MSGFTINGQSLTTFVSGNTVQTGGKFTGSGTGNSSSQTPSKVNPGLNFGFTVDGVDINLYNTAPYTDYNSTGGSWSNWVNVPSWCKSISYVLRGGAGGAGSWGGYCVTDGNSDTSVTLARPGGNGGNGGRTTGTINNPNSYRIIGGGGGGGGSGVRNLYISGGNSQVLGYDWNNGAIYDYNCLGNNGGGGGASYISFNGSGDVYDYADAGGGGNRGLPGCVRRYSYGDNSQILANSANGNAGNNGNDRYNSTNYGNYNQVSGGIINQGLNTYNVYGASYGYPYNSSTWTAGSDNYNWRQINTNYGGNNWYNWLWTYNGQNGNQKTNIPGAPGGGGGTVRVFLRAGTD